MDDLNEIHSCLIEFANSLMHFGLSRSRPLIIINEEAYWRYLLEVSAMAPNDSPITSDGGEIKIRGGDIILRRK